MKIIVIALALALVFFIVICHANSQSNDTVKIRYSNGINMISKDPGLAWEKKQLYGPIVTFKKLDGTIKKSFDYGRTWSKPMLPNPVVRFTSLDGTIKVSYDNGKTWNMEIEDNISSTINIFPNPSYSSIVYLEFVTNDEEIDIEIFNMSGVKLKSYPYQAVEGVNKIPVEMTGLLSGNYIINIVGKHTNYKSMVSLIL